MDLVLRLREQIAQSNLPIKPDVRDKLQVHVEAILRTLPDDLRSVLESN